MDINNITGQIVDAAMKVHTALGPGLLESAYEACLAHELKKRGFSIERQKEMPVEYDGILIDIGYRLDLLVNDKVVVELKAVSEVAPKKPIGLLINFNVQRLKDGIKRFAN